MLKCLAKDEAGLRHHALNRIHQQEHSIHHAKHSLHFTAKVRVTRRIDQLNSHALILDSGALGLDRNASLPLQITRVHHAIFNHLIFPEGATLTQQTIHECRLSVVNVSHDGEISEIFSRFFSHTLGS